MVKMTFLGNAIHARAHNLPPHLFPGIGGAVGYKGAWERERTFFCTKEAQNAMVHTWVSVFPLKNVWVFFFLPCDQRIFSLLILLWVERRGKDLLFA